MKLMSFFFYCSAVSEQILLPCHCKIILLYLIRLEYGLLSFSSMADADSIMVKNIVLKIKSLLCVWLCIKEYFL